MRTNIAIVILVVFIIGCTQPQDDDTTPVIFSSYNEGNFTIRIFELKTDSTFRYWRDLGKIFDTQGYWKMKSDTFLLYSSKIDPVFYGKIYFIQEDGITRPFFELSPDDSSLLDMTNHNARLSMKYLNPPKNLDFRITRKKPNNCMQ